jgi:hypothetical protein
MFFGFFYRINYFFYKKIFLFLFFSTEFFFLSFILYVYDKSANKGQKTFFYFKIFEIFFILTRETNFYKNILENFFI